MTDEAAPSLEQVLAEAAAELEAVDEAATPGGAVEWSIDGIVFAAVNGGRAEFRLDPMVAAAALRTPDTSRSRRGPDWVSFRPETLDDPALDRAEAWFGSAWRRAERP